MGMIGKAAGVLGVVAAALAATMGGEAGAAPRDVAARVAERFALPRYEAFATASRGLAATLERTCAAPSGAGVGEAQAAFQAAADAWNGVALLRYGPVVEDFRAETLYHWPERKNATTKALAALLAGGEAVDAGLIARASAGAQGLPALERLLFEETSVLATPAGARRCALASAIGAHVARLAGEIHAGWGGAGGLLARLRGGDEVLAVEALTRFATDYVTAAQFNTDSRLSPVLATGPAAAKPQAAELWRSGRASRALRIEIEAADALLGALIEGGQGIDKALAASRETVTIARGLPADFGAAAQDASGRRPFVALRDAIREARDEAVKAMPGALGITLGFNSLDGD